MPLLGLIGMAFGAGWLGVMFGFAIQAAGGGYSENGGRS
jgi:hypothetical protein